MGVQVDIRPERADDRMAVFALNSRAFGRDSEARLVDALRNNAEVFIPALSLLATKGEAIVGHILLTRIKIQDGKGNRHASLALAPMAVEPGLQKRGIGSQLVRTGLETAGRLGFRSVVVLGHAHYYPKFGFVPAAKWDIRAPFEVSADVFMAIELTEGGLKGVSGTVLYPDEFRGV